MEDQIMLINTASTGQIELSESILDWNEDETCHYNGVKLKFSRKRSDGTQPLNTYGFA